MFRNLCSGYTRATNADTDTDTVFLGNANYLEDMQTTDTDPETAIYPAPRDPINTPNHCCWSAWHYGRSDGLPPSRIKTQYVAKHLNQCSSHQQSTNILHHRNPVYSYDTAMQTTTKPTTTDAPFQGWGCLKRRWLALNLASLRTTSSRNPTLRTPQQSVHPGSFLRDITTYLSTTSAQTPSHLHQPRRYPKSPRGHVNNIPIQHL
ncbi:hypothetical protein NEDG_00768 [Nematocida displodere]|uniref:Uncharacterized protein n=1 Tax=Nematocida displodere TaxID=1805483 RepID=A0A177ECG0_9MICR|nr:hypothetical protein NEDG_00768 [Nematocida displodere]